MKYSLFNWAKLGSFAIFVALAAQTSQYAYADSADHKERKLKAAILFNLVRYFEWPEGDHTADHNLYLTTCIQSDDELRPYLNSLVGKQANGRTFQLEIVDDISEVPVGRCAIIYASADTLKELDSDLIVPYGVLSVSDDKKFYKNGGCATIARYGRNIRFALNQNSIETAGISASSKILTLAKDLY